MGGKKRGLFKARAFFAARIADLIRASNERLFSDEDLAYLYMSGQTPPPGLVEAVRENIGKVVVALERGRTAHPNVTTDAVMAVPVTTGFLSAKARALGADVVLNADDAKRYVPGNGYGFASAGIFVIFSSKHAITDEGALLSDMGYLRTELIKDGVGKRQKERGKALITSGVMTKDRQRELQGQPMALPAPVAPRQ